MDIVCAQCGETFTAHRPARFCSVRCRVAAHRAAKPATPVTPVTPVTEGDLAAARARIAELESEVARLKASPPFSMPCTGEALSEAWRRAEEQRKQRATASRAARQEKIVAQADPELTREDLLVKLAERERQIKGLQTKLKNERGKVAWFQRLGKKGNVALLDTAGRKKIMACLHPDRAQSEAEKTRLHDAFTLFQSLPFCQEG